jgi:hypothetical protein
MLVLGRKQAKRVAVFHGGRFAGWVEYLGHRYGEAKLGFDQFDQEYTFLREELLSDEQRSLTCAERVR